MRLVLVVCGEVRETPAAKPGPQPVELKPPLLPLGLRRERRVLSLFIERGPPKGPWAAWAWAGPLHRDLARVNQGSSV